MTYVNVCEYSIISRLDAKNNDNNDKLAINVIMKQN